MNIKSTLLGAALLATVVTSANATVVFQYGYSAFPGTTTGTDAFSNSWSWSTNATGGDSAWGTPGLLAGIASYTGAKSSNNFEITFQLPVGVIGAIDQTPSTGAGGSNLFTRLDVEVAGAWVEWNTKFVGANQVAFFAPTAADAITAGDNFFVNVAFTTSNFSGSNAGFSAAWTETTTSGVPEVSTWAMMLAGFAGLGFVGYRRNKAANFAA